MNMAADGTRAKTSSFSIQVGGDGTSRLQSAGKGTSRSPGTFSRSKYGVVSYEDLLVTQYLDEIRREKSVMPAEKEIPASPYLQRLPHSNLCYGKLARRNKHIRQRPMSASHVCPDTKPKIDAKFIADTTLWDPATPRNGEWKQGFKMRPASAPIKRTRPLSGVSVSSIGSRRSRPRSAYKSLFKRQPHTIKVFAFKNGSRDSFVHAAAPNMKILLELTTEKLGLPFAARRLFLEDGVEVLDPTQIPANADVYVSMGENYKDPFEATKKNMLIRQGAKWNLHGIILPEDRKKNSRLKMSKRLRSLAQKNFIRILIYKNGRSSEHCEVVVEPDKFDEFLLACTGRLDLRNFARKAFDWEGHEITDLEDIPVLDDCLQTKGSQVRGPLWISCGERFSPLGIQEFLLNIRHMVTSKLKQAKAFRKEINFALNDENDKITLASVKAKNGEELYEALEKVDTDIDQLKETLARLNSKLEAIRKEAQEEESMGAEYRMAHIQNVKTDDPLVGKPGLRLKVYENGQYDGGFIFYFNIREALRGVETKERLMERLLDELSFSQRASCGPQPRLAAVAQRIYNKYGHEITDVLTLQNIKRDSGEKIDPEIWVSYGEPFICPFTYCLEIVIDRAIKGITREGTEHVLREQLVDHSEIALTQESSKWEAINTFPVLYDAQDDDKLKYDPDKVTSLREYSEVDSHATFLQLKSNQNMVLFPEVTVNEKPRRGHSDAQIWVISKGGVICNKAFPYLCLAVSETSYDGTLFDNVTSVQGFKVILKKKMIGNPNQTWRFAPDGTISSEAYPHLPLTYLGNKSGDDNSSYVENKSVAEFPGMHYYLIITNPLPKKHASYQRFALKQERFDNLGQWKHTDAENPEWNKQALSWPIKQDGTLNTDYDWPMEGFILPNAPPLRSSKKGAGFTALPLRLMVLKNGERNKTAAVPVVGPNLTTMMKHENKKNKPDKSKKKRKQDSWDADDNVYTEDLNLHCLDFTVNSLEFTMFLDSCTSLLNLPFSARRLFDEFGTEHFTLQTLKRDQLVFVSCGELWSDPKLSLEEQKRRNQLSQLSSDVDKIRQYCALRNPENFVMEVEGGLVPKSRLIVNKQWISNEESKTDAHEEKERGMLQETFQDMEELSDNSGSLTAHERSHVNADERFNTLKWPWEKVVNLQNSMDASDMEAQKYSDPELYQKFKPKHSPRMSHDMLQRFVYEDGFIACACNTHLVLGISSQESRTSEVILVKRLPDDLTQRWIILSNGEIHSRYNQKQVLTVSFPTQTERQGDHSSPQSFIGCSITLQTRRANQFGRAHQLWHYDAETGFISAFNTNLNDKEITAANKADVCTFAISGKAEIDQPGYEAEVPSKRHGLLKLKVCVSCARAMRGRHKLEAVPPNTPFYCAMGDAKQLKISQVGSFRALNGKVDLSTYEADLTLQKWIDELELLRKETSTTAIAGLINAARTVITVKVMAYKNGEGRMRPGEIICGSTVEGILMQCTHRLGLTTSARRLYAEDGTQFLDTDDIVSWAIENYRNTYADMMDSLWLEKGDQQQIDNRDKEEHLGDSDISDVKATDKSLSGALATVQLEEEEENTSDQKDAGQDTVAHDNETDEQEQQEQASNVPEDGKVDTLEASKIAKRREKLLRNVVLPPLEEILRYPVEVWVSSTKNFVAPEVVESKEENRRKKRALRAQACLELDIEKHILRQMKGRRFKDQNPGTYLSTLSTEQPVVREGHWQDTTVEEKVKHEAVHKLEKHLGEIHSNQKMVKPKVVGIDPSGPLYKQPAMKRVNVFPNGGNPEHFVTVWGETLRELLDSATLKLGLWKKASHFYTEEGKRIETFDEIEMKQLLCISCGKQFIRPQTQNAMVEVRANWGRARKQYGPQATDITVDVKKNPIVDVDPFGPPQLALPLTQGRK